MKRNLLFNIVFPTVPIFLQPGSMGGWLFCLFYGGERQCSNADRAVENMQGENLQIILERLQQNARNENDCPTNG